MLAEGSFRLKSVQKRRVCARRVRTWTGSCKRRLFPTTRWSLVLAVGGFGVTSEKALESLCQIYWPPVYEYARYRELFWEYSVPVHGRATFSSRNVSSAQQLPNGNTLIAEGALARIFEVTPDNEIVWEAAVLGVSFRL